MQVLNQPTKIQVLLMPTYQLLVHKNQTTIYIHMLQVLEEGK